MDLCHNDYIDSILKQVSGQHKTNSMLQKQTFLKEATRQPQAKITQQCLQKVRQYNMPNTAATPYNLPVCTFDLAVTLKTSDCVSLDESDTLVLIVLLIEGGHFLVEHLGHQPVLWEYHCDCKAVLDA